MDKLVPRRAEPNTCLPPPNRPPHPFPHPRTFCAHPTPHTSTTRTLPTCHTLPTTHTAHTATGLGGTHSPATASHHTCPLPAHHAGHRHTCCTAHARHTTDAALPAFSRRRRCRAAHSTHHATLRAHALHHPHRTAYATRTPSCRYPARAPFPHTPAPTTHALLRFCPHLYPYRRLPLPRAAPAYLFLGLGFTLHCRFFAAACLSRRPPTARDAGGGPLARRAAHRRSRFAGADRSPACGPPGCGLPATATSAFVFLHATLACVLPA